MSYYRDIRRTVYIQIARTDELLQRYTENSMHPDCQDWWVITEIYGELYTSRLPGLMSYYRDIRRTVYIQIARTDELLQRHTENSIHPDCQDWWVITEIYGEQYTSRLPGLMSYYRDIRRTVYIQIARTDELLQRYTENSIHPDCQDWWVITEIYGEQYTSRLPGLMSYYRDIRRTVYIQIARTDELLQRYTENSIHPDCQDWWVITEIYGEQYTSRLPGLMSYYRDIRRTAYIQIARTDELLQRYTENSIHPDCQDWWVITEIYGEQHTSRLPGLMSYYRDIRRTAYIQIARTDELLQRYTENSIHPGKRTRE